MWSWSTNVTDNGRTTCNRNTALCTIVHRAVKTSYFSKYRKNRRRSFNLPIIFTGCLLPLWLRFLPESWDAQMPIITDPSEKIQSCVYQTIVWTARALNEEDRVWLHFKNSFFTVIYLVGQKSTVVTQTELGGLTNGIPQFPIVYNVLELLQEAQLPQRNSASAAYVYLGWLTDRAMHRTPQNRQGCTISDIQTLWFNKCWLKTHFVMK